MVWIDLDQGRYRWQALVNAVINLWIPYNVAQDLLASQEGLCSME